MIKRLIIETLKTVFASLFIVALGIAITLFGGVVANTINYASAGAQKER